MRVVLLGPSYPYRGGIAHHTALLARHLEARHDVTLLTFRRQYPGWLFPGRTDRDPSEDRVAARAERVLAPLLPWTWWQAARRAAAARPDVVLVQWWVPFWAPSVAVFAALVRWMTGARVAFICHNVLPHDGGGVLDRWLTRLALGRGDAFVTHSAADAEALRGLLGERLEPDAVHRAVLPAHTIAEPMNRAAAREALGLPAEVPVALFFGFVRPYKGLEHLVEAVGRAAEALPELRLVVAGEFWLPAEDFRAQATELGIAERLHIDDRYVPNEEVARYFAAADVVVLPYLEATQSGVVTLAATFGRPVIATRVGGLPEMVRHEENGLIVPPGDAAALAGALERLSTEPGLRERLRQGMRAAQDRFAWDGWGPLVEVLAGVPSSGSSTAEAVDVPADVGLPDAARSDVAPSDVPPSGVGPDSAEV